MNQTLIEQRHPVLGAAVRGWRAGEAGALPPNVVEHIVRLSRDKAGGRWQVVASGCAVNGLYGRDLVGGAVCDLAPEGEEEADVARSGGRPVLIEETVVIAARPIRLARLYLPLVCGAGDGDVLCCVVAM